MREVLQRELERLQRETAEDIIGKIDNETIKEVSEINKRLKELLKHDVAVEIRELNEKFNDIMDCLVEKGHDLIDVHEALYTYIEGE